MRLLVNHVMKHQVLECGCLWSLCLLLSDNLYHLRILVNHVVKHQVIETVLEDWVPVAVTPANNYIRAEFDDDLHVDIFEIQLIEILIFYLLVK